MKPQALRQAFVAVLIIGGIAVGTPAQGPADTSGKLTSAQKRAISRLTASFRRAQRDPQQRLALLRQAMLHGPPAVEALLPVIDRELRPQLARYRSRFSAQAALRAKRQLNKQNLEEAARLRQTVLGLQTGNDLTKETIVERGDPAMQRLAEIFLVSREQIIAGSKQLQAERQRIALLGQFWERCELYMFENLPEGQRPENPPNFENYLQGEEAIALGMAAPMPAATRKVLATNTRLAENLDTEEARAILALNLMRALLGLSPVAVDLKLCAAARDHAADMHKLDFFSHESPVPGKRTPWDRAKRFGAVANAENIFMGIADGRAANLGWFHSPPHHKNMLGNYSRVGMGRSGSYFTEMFGR